MVKNSDVLFGRTAATYKLVKREDIKKCVIEVSTLKVLGVKKHISQVMYEYGLLSKDQIFAIYYSLISTKHIKKVRNYKVCSFNENDDAIIFEKMGIKKEIITSKNDIDTSNFVASFGVSIEDIKVCLNIQKNLEESQIHLPFLNILFHKKLLSAQIEKLIPNIQDKKDLICIKNIDTAQAKKSNAILINQIAIINNKISKEEAKEALEKWSKIRNLGLSLKYIEVCFYLEFLTIEECEKIIFFLKKVSNIKYSLRFHIIRLDEKQETFFSEMYKNEQLKKEIITEGKALQEKILVEGIKIRLSDILLIQGKLKKESITKKRDDSRRLKLVQEVSSSTKKVEPSDNALSISQDVIDTQEIVEKVESSDDTLSISQDVIDTQEIVEKVESSDDALSISQDSVIDTQEMAETEEFEQELNKTFSESQTVQKRALQKEIKNLREKLKGASPAEVKTINTILGYYQKTEKTLFKSFIIVTSVMLFLFLGIFIAYQQSSYKLKQNSINENSQKTKIEKKTLRDLYQESQVAIKKYQFNDVHKTYLKIIEKKNDSNLIIRANEFKLLHNMFEELKERISTEKKLVPLAKKQVYINTIEKNHFEITQKNKKIQKIQRKQISPQDLYEVLMIYNFNERYSWEMLLFSYEYKLPTTKALVSFMQKYPKQRQKASMFFAKKIGIPMPEGGYFVFDGEIISKKEYDKKIISIKKLEKTVIAQIKKTKVTKKKTSEEIWLNKQNQNLRSRIFNYKKEAKKDGYIFFEGRLTSPQSVKKETDVQQKIINKQVFFKNTWHNKTKLGIWHNIVLSKEYLSGYLSKSSGDLYILRTNKGDRYLTENQIIEKTVVQSPWEKYWTLNQNVKNTENVYQLGLWCIDENLLFEAKRQFERVLTLDPSHIGAQNFISRGQEKKDNKIYFLGSWVSLIEGRYQGLVVQNGKIMSEFDLLSKTKTSKRIDKKRIAKQIFGGNPRQVGKNSWSLKYKFQPNMQLGKWENISHGKTTVAGAIINQYLEIAAEEGITPRYAYLNIPFIGSLQVKYKGQIAPRHKNNLYVKIYQETNNDNSGYLFALNWHEKNQKRKNIIQSYQNNKLEIISSVKSPIIPSKKFHNINIISSKGNVFLSIGGHRILGVRQNTMHSKGGVAFGTFNSKVRFDDIHIIGDVDKNWYQKQRKQAEEILQKETINNWIQGLPTSQKKYILKIKEEARSAFLTTYQLYIMKKYSLAWQRINELLDESPENPFFLLTRARISNATKNFEAAIADCSQAITIINEKKEDEIYTIYTTRGFAYQNLGRDNEALQDYTQAQVIAPDELISSYMLTNLYMKKDNRENAIEIMKEYIQGKPKDLSAQNILKMIQELPNAPEKKSTHKTTNYIVTSDSNEKSDVVIGEYLQNIKKRFENITGCKSKNIMLKVKLFSNDSHPYSNYVMNSQPKNSNFAYYPDYKVIAGSTNINKDTLLQNVSGASICQLMHQEQLYFPHWVKEGLVTYFTQRKQVSLYHSLKIIDLLQKHASLKMLNVNKNFYHPEIASINKTISYAWVYFLIRSKYKNSFRKYLKNVGYKGKSKQFLNSKIFKNNYNKIEKEFIIFWKKTASKRINK